MASYTTAYDNSIITLHEMQVYLKEKNELDKQVIQRNTDIVQPPGTSICGHLCLYVLKSLSDGTSFRDTLNSLTTEGSGIKWSNPLADELHKLSNFLKTLRICA